MKEKKSVAVPEQQVQNPLSNFSIKQYILGEINPTSTETWDSEKYHILRDRVHAFLSVPMNLEKFMAYGTLVTLDHFLHVYTLLPLRVCALLLQVLWKIPSLLCLKFHVIRPHQVCDFLKFALILSCTWAFCYLDTSIIYHKIRSQSIIKLYIFFNLLDVSDKLLSAVGQDALDSLTWTVVKTKFRMHHAFRVLGHIIVSFVCMATHAFVILLQTIILNVALNSHNKSILTIMLSNNFVEVKGSVFKRFAKNNLFQMACSDVRERFHLFAMLALVVFRNLSTSTWYKDDLEQLFMDVVLVLISEVIVDWVKHAFITKFNDIPPNVYGEFSVSLSYDVLKVHEKKMYTDYFDQASRRVGLTPIPLSCIINSIAYRTMGGSLCGLILLCIMPLLIVMKLTLHLFLRIWSYSHVRAYEKESVNVVPSNGGTHMPRNQSQTNVNDSLLSDGSSRLPTVSGITSTMTEEWKQPPSRDVTKSALAELAWLEQVKLQHIRRVRSDSHFVSSCTKSSRALLSDYVQSVLLDGSDVTQQASHHKSSSPKFQELWKPSSTCMSIKSSSANTLDEEQSGSTPRANEVEKPPSRPDVIFHLGTESGESHVKEKSAAEEVVNPMSDAPHSSDSLTPVNQVGDSVGGLPHGDEDEMEEVEGEPRKPERSKSVNLLIDAVVGLAREDTLRLHPSRSGTPEVDIVFDAAATVPLEEVVPSHSASMSLSTEETVTLASTSASQESLVCGDRDHSSTVRSSSLSNANSGERDMESVSHDEAEESIMGLSGGSNVRQRVRTRTQSTSTVDDGVVNSFTVVSASEQNPSAVVDTTEVVIAAPVSVKQPLSDVDRYTMVSSQIVL